MKRGDVVTIYEDPYTKLKPEGAARLRKRLYEMPDYNGCAVERWTVQFPDGEYDRIIVVDE